MTQQKWRPSHACESNNVIISEIVEDRRGTSGS